MRPKMKFLSYNDNKCIIIIIIINIKSVLDCIDVKILFYFSNNNNNNNHKLKYLLLYNQK